MSADACCTPGLACLGFWRSVSVNLPAHYGLSDRANRGWSVRIAGSAMAIAVSNPSKVVLTAEIILQSIGLSPLLLEVSLVLLRRYVLRLLKRLPILMSRKRTSWTKRPRKLKVSETLTFLAYRLSFPSHLVFGLCRSG